MRERDRATSATLRSTLAALENAEAVPAVTGLGATTSARVSGAALGLGAAEVERLVLDGSAEAAIVWAEIEGLTEAATTYAGLGEGERAAAALHGAEVVTEVVHRVLGTTWG